MSWRRKPGRKGGVRYRLAIFGVDGTLADTLPWFLRAGNRPEEAHGFSQIEAGDLDTLRGSTTRQVVAHLGIPAWQRPRIGVDLRRLMAADIGRMRLFDGIGDMLRGLADWGWPWA